MANRSLVLASSSIPRQELLKRLQIPFEVAHPDVDETPFANEAPIHLVKRLAELKAKAVKEAHPDAIIIGADQVGVLNNVIIGKPLTLENAREQLRASSGQSLRFFIGLCVYDARSNYQQLTVEEFTVTYRMLTDAMIDAYLRKEQPLHCAGACKVEGLGIALLQSLDGKDYTALIGLPLLRLVEMLTQAGLSPFF